MTAHTLYFTVGSRDAALKISRTLVEERLVACANVVDGATSVYRWNGQLCEDREAIVFAKTTSSCILAAIHRVRQIHEYDCPCVVAWELNAISEPYWEWIQQETEGRVT